MERTDDLELLNRFHRCSHLLHASGRYRGQGRLLILLLERGTLTQRELIDITGRRSATISEQLDNMERSGLIVRAKNERDRRNIDVTLTPKGEEEARAFRAYRVERAKNLFAGLSEEDKAQLLRILNQLSKDWAQLPTESEATRR